jgi:hypothetical protein
VASMHGIARFLTRHRLATVLVGGTLMLGVVGLSAHQALPEHHHGQDAICIAALAIAVAAIALWKPRQAGIHPVRRLILVSDAPPLPPLRDAGILPAARAGPACSVISRR